MVRVERLGEPTQELLRLLAAGRRVSHDVLAEASGLDPAALRAALREAAEAHLVDADPQDRYRFRHALLREVVHDDLLPGEHAELHLALARVLELRVAEHPDDPYLSAGLAHHYLSGGDQPAALAAAVRAAGTAEARARPRRGGAAARARARHLGPRPRRAGADRDEPRRSCWPAWAPTSSCEGDHARAQAALERALDELGPDADPHAAAGVLDRLALAQWRQGRADEARASIARGLSLLPEDDSPERAGILARNAKLLMLQGRFRECVPAAREAIDVARRAQEREAEVVALNALGVALTQTGAVDEGRATLREAIGLSESPGDAASAYVNLADALHVAGLSLRGARGRARGPGPRRRVARRQRLARDDGRGDRMGARRLGARAVPRARAAARPPRHDADVRRAAAGGDRAGGRRRRACAASCSSASRTA